MRFYMVTVCYKELHFRRQLGSQISLCYRCNDRLFQNSDNSYKALAQATNTMVFLSKILKHKVTWSKSYILFVAVVLDQQSQVRVLKKNSSNPLNSGRLTDDINCQKVLERVNFFQVKAFRADHRQLVLIRLINAVLLTLQH